MFNLSNFLGALHSRLVSNHITVKIAFLSLDCNHIEY